MIYYWLCYFLGGALYVCLPYTQGQIEKSYTESNDVDCLSDKEKLFALQIGYILTIVLFPLIISIDVLARFVQNKDSKIALIIFAVLTILFVMSPYLFFYYFW